MGVRYLLDTHVMLWLLGQPERVPARVREVLADPAVDLLVSAVSAMEIATKTRLGKLPDVGLVQAWPRRLDDMGAVEVPLTGQHAITAGSMSWPHRDPFDRLLASVAIHEGATLVSVDAAFADLPAPTLLSW
ncbi:type II toxin-antitoxin system VapC family toxin [Arsenicicoccus cauae]|uniref:PIN domain-containing protein n=1 Tax=Arsenicicoccus cauae TaxID=2663847 RepID=A0A6I3IAE4_9MICO|nr:type II toxin-antitoxin system VapC family toxin [Arsenicicoccus cauae]MTB71178.1 PIN domain-containing protein [Arsenicicoccus cauae]